MKLKRFFTFTILSGFLLSVAIPIMKPAVAAAAYNPAPWTNLLLPAPLGYSPTTSNVCSSGSISCVDATIAQMQNQLAPLLATCDHKAAFNLIYQRITEAYKTTALTPGYYQNPAYLNQMDVVFASYYLNQRTAWENGDLAHVSDAWKIAFDAADNKKVTAMGDIFLAINAHIIGDEAHVLDQMGLVYPDGTTAKNDYNLDNQWLYAAYSPSLAEVARRLDPTANQPVVINQPPLDALTFQLMAAWREQAWRFAEQLKLAETLHSPLLYNTIRTEMNTAAVANANAIRLATTATPQQVADRDAYCEVHRYDP